MPDNGNKKGLMSSRPKKLGLEETTTALVPPKSLSQVAQDNGPLGMGSLTGMAMDRRRREDESGEGKKKNKFKGIQDTGVGYGG